MQQNTRSPHKTQPFRLNTMIIALLSAALLLGIFIGVSLTSVANSNPENIASSVYIDSAAPDANVCVQYGASAIVTDTRIFLTLNPFKVYVTQPRMQPGCVLRTSDWAILQQRNLITSQQTSNCKNSLNTFAYTGKLEDSPQVSCVYPNDAAGNLFASQGQNLTKFQ
ncbi:MULTISPECIES: DUF3172 domain-containing protein [Nostoc]|uniref:DUF3172 domain-containing protein n=1 Tax=Nostoc paludosum FACHB-159 TaxID=2692908 RepID=A0ABR8KHW5_9NOSO|nr:MULTISPECIES: DUF3172 domain-containing protein [Nostoc]MBD2681304.1 DUF3172 domain-containing protein [Nostoc sp. FACHB-857]MBD2737783.1 DUF3172 domain-containing protein [Nostoc paludosum FACHB-159]